MKLLRGLTLAGCALLTLTGCAQAESEATPSVDATTESQAPVQTESTEQSAETDTAPEPNCANIFTDKVALRSEKIEGWGLRIQAPVTSGEFEVPIPRHMVDEKGRGEKPAVDPIAVDRALQCQAYGKSPEASNTYFYVEPAEFDHDAFVTMLQEDLQMEPYGDNGYQIPEDKREERAEWVYVGDDYFIWGLQSIADQDLLDDISGTFDDADPNDYLPEDVTTQSCGMFFAEPVHEGFSTTHSEYLTALKHDKTLTTDREFGDDPNSYMNVVCEEINWHEADPNASEVEPRVPEDAKQVSENDVCAVYELSDGSGYVVDCGEEGHATEIADKDVAELILPPMFRGFDGV